MGRAQCCLKAAPGIKLGLVAQYHSRDGRLHRDPAGLGHDLCPCKYILWQWQLSGARHSSLPLSLPYCFSLWAELPCCLALAAASPISGHCGRFQEKMEHPLGERCFVLQWHTLVEHKEDVNKSLGDSPKQTAVRQWHSGVMWHQSHPQLTPG